MLGHGQGGWKGLAAQDTEAARSALVDKTRSDPDFWSLAGLIELDMLQALADGKLADAQGSLESRFAVLQGRVGAPWAWGSVADQAEMTLGAYARSGNGTQRKAAESLDKLLRGFAN